MKLLKFVIEILGLNVIPCLIIPCDVNIFSNITDRVIYTIPERKMVPIMIDLPSIDHAVSVGIIVRPVRVEAEIEVKIIEPMAIFSSPLCDAGIDRRSDDIHIINKRKAMGTIGEGIENSFRVSFTNLSCS